MKNKKIFRTLAALCTCLMLMGGFLTLSVCHCVSRSFPAKGFGDFPNKQNGRPGRGGTGRFSEVWLHFLCLLFLFFSAISTFGKLQTTRKTGTSPEKSAKK